MTEAISNWEETELATIGAMSSIYLTNTLTTVKKLPTY